MGNWLKIRGTITVFDKKALVIFQPVRCSGYRVIEPVRMIILEQLTGSLLEIGCSDDG